LDLYHPSQAKDVTVPIATINPATGETIKTFTPATDDEVDAAIARAHERFLDYRHSTTFAQRAEWANATADLLEKEADDTAAMMTLEMGKTLASAKAEVLKCAKGFRYYAENAEKLLADEPAEAEKVGAKQAYVRYQPLGVVLAVMPWNFPLWQAVRFAAPALMAGNVGILKHASNVPQTALYLADVITRGGFPEGCFQTLLVSSSAVERILRDPRVAAATLTGSEPAGQSVAAICGDEIKPSVMELGGSDPFIVMPSADLDEAVKTAVKARVQNNGQSCIAAKRFIVHGDIYDAFVDKYVAQMQALKVGDPTDPDTDVGPLATESGRDDIAKQVEDAAAAGAKVRCGGQTPEGPGWFYPPTVITDITKDMALYTEEVFGPVASMYRAADIDEAIEIANATTFGLGSNAWTKDEAEQQRFIDDIEAGQVFINGMTVSYPELGFGGIKRSGYGRELAGLGIREFCNAKTVWIAKTESAATGTKVE
jgi:succinate-semialdehyde dehydrogenase/glutarate-semialdehyde dehydrogenase